jgi:pimeloyl-ACP methyl ester carboxylesterase
MRTLLLILIAITSFGQTITEKVTASGIQYAEYGEAGWPLIVYLHGISEVGKTPSALLAQSPFCRGWNAVEKKPEGFLYPEFFTKNIRVVAPVLKSGFWEPDYINKFLDEINTDNLVCLMGWSWGGGGVAKYINQPIKKYNFKCAVAMSMGNYSLPGTNVTCPVKLVHALDDNRTPFENSDKFYAGVPEQFKAGYLRLGGGGHNVWSRFLQPSTGIYEWIKSFSSLVTYTQGTIELGSDGLLYVNFNGVRRKLNP